MGVTRIAVAVVAGAMLVSAFAAPASTPVERRGGLQYRRLPGNTSENADADGPHAPPGTTSNKVTSAESPALAPCCADCAGRAFCSPKSGNCHDSKPIEKDYYEPCGGGDGLAPPPPPPSGGKGGKGGGGGLVPPPPPPSASCCGSCVGRDFCSPVSRDCHDSKPIEKDYYLNCKPMLPDALVWSDEFEDPLGNGLVNRSKWFYDNGPNPANQELQYYTDRPENSRVENGSLKIIAKCEEYSGRRRHQYTSARLVTRGLGEWGPGHRLEVRAKLPVGIGTWPAIWMLPDNLDKYGGWPHSGEIDIMESVGCDQGQVYGTVHTGAFNHMKNTQVGRNYDCDYGAWQTYTIDWEEHMIKWYTNGVHYHTFSPDTSSSAEWPFDKDFYLILNVAVGGSWGGYCLHGKDPSCTSDSHFAQEQVMEVDYVRVYTLKPNDAGARRLDAQAFNDTLV